MVRTRKREWENKTVAFRITGKDILALYEMEM